MCFRGDSGKTHHELTEEELLGWQWHESGSRRDRVRCLNSIPSAVLESRSVVGLAWVKSLEIQNLGWWTPQKVHSVDFGQPLRQDGNRMFCPPNLRSLSSCGTGVAFAS